MSTNEALKAAATIELIQLMEEKDQRIKDLEAIASDYAAKLQRLEDAALKVIGWCRQEAMDRTGDPNNAEFYSCVKELRAALAFMEMTR